MFANEDWVARINAVNTMPPSLLEALIALVGLVERVVSAPPTPGIEALLIETGDEPLQARFMARVIVGCGERWAEERATIEKPLASVLRQISKHGGARSFIISRRARALQILLHRGESDGFINRGLEQAGSLLSTEALRDITARAADGDETACYRLAEIARNLVPYLPDPRGRRVSSGTGIHLFLVSHLSFSGHPSAYTWSDEKDDFVDRLTRAARVLLRDPKFDPRPACRLYRKGAVPDH